jgi:hypothetical protein
MRTTPGKHTYLVYRGGAWRWHGLIRAVVFGCVAEISKTADLSLAVLITLREQGPMAAPALARALSLNRTVLHRLSQVSGRPSVAG